MRIDNSTKGKSKKQPVNNIKNLSKGLARQLNTKLTINNSRIRNFKKQPIKKVENV